MKNIIFAIPYHLRRIFNYKYRSIEFGNMYCHIYLSSILRSDIIFITHIKYLPPVF